jgi:two-component system cell cycle sensor histidine kinase/response regulator CckA
MGTVSIAFASLGAVTAIAIAVAWLAVVRARAARLALAISEARHGDAAERDRQIEAGSRLAADVAHDLNDLLTAITGHTELLIAGLDPAGASIEDANQIRRAAASAALLTRPLRTLSGGHRASTDIIDVNAVTERTASALERMLGPRIDVALTLDKDLKRVKVGASHVEEIVLNLGVRARDVMPGGGRLTLTTMMHAQNGGDGHNGEARQFVRMIIADTGVAMTAAAQGKLFEPFLAGEEAGRTAMGLAKVNAIVKEAGGRIQVESTVGLGTTFTIDLPAMSDAPTVSLPTPAESRLAAPVLVVEDEPRVRELIRMVLVRAGHDVVAVEGPHAALAALHRQPAIALMLVDVVMPEMDGYNLLVEARTISPAIRAVLMSGFAPDLTRYPAGDTFLPKPFTVEALVGVVDAALAAP